MKQSMLVRTLGGAWEPLAPITTLPEGGVLQLLGDDLGPVFGHGAPLPIVAVQPQLAAGTPDAICVDGDGNITVIAMTIGGAAETALPNLLGYAGALHGMTYDEFEKLCGTALGSHGGLAAYIHEYFIHTDFHRSTFEVTVSDALAQGRFRLVALMKDTPDHVRQSMRFLNASGAEISCFDIKLFASDSVTAAHAEAVDVGQTQRSTEFKITAAGMLALTERSCGEPAMQLMKQLQKFCTENCDSVVYEGDTSGASLSAWLTAEEDGEERDPALVTATSEGAVSIGFESLAPFDPNWRLRDEMVIGLNRLLGADLGEARTISQLNLTIAEHLMDATLIELLCEILKDAITRTGRSSLAAA